MLKAIFMDFDGLIVDTEVVWYQIYARWFRSRMGYDLPVEEFLACVGSSPEALFSKLEVERGFAIDRDQFGQDTQEQFIRESRELPIKSGVEEFLQQAVRVGLCIALTTSSGREKPSYHLKRLNLIQYFDFLVTAEEVKRIKPYPDLFIKAAHLAGIRRDQALVVEDSLNGLRAGTAGGFRVLVVPNQVTRHCEFRGYYKMADTLLDVNVNRLIREYETELTVEEKK